MSKRDFILLAFELYRKRLTSAKDEEKREKEKQQETILTMESPPSPKKDRNGCHVYEGVCLPLSVSTQTLDVIKTLDVREDDVWILNYPRSGGIWIQEIVLCIMYKADIDAINNIPLTDRLSLLESIESSQNKQYPTFDNFENMESPRLVHTSLPYHMLPMKIHSKKPKIIYLARNPKDVIASYYTYYQNSPEYTSTEWDKFLEDFIKGNVAYGSWYPHLSTWWMEYRTSNNVLFLKYEDMIKDLRSIVIQTALFLGKRLDDDLVDAITSHCTFQNMKNRSEEGNGKMSTYFTKGEVGAWEDKFTVTQNKQYDAEIDKHLLGTGLRFDYEHVVAE
ncbi:sulfotransferase 4A1-like isoform X2 [Ptychodera flava]|uniref:sulfotransferase 4A1-like isoform X2 n=1 Tax=Ptychodera flava TaxID=63121 RepID=UPI00396A97AF